MPMRLGLLMPSYLEDKITVGKVSVDVIMVGKML
jgi:hypothetical protein